MPSKILISILTALSIRISVVLVNADDDHGWTQLSGTARHISAKGDELWAISKYGQPMRWNGKKWEQKRKAIPKGPPWGLGTMIGATTDGNPWMTDFQRQRPNVFRYDKSSNDWNVVENMGYTSTVNGYISVDGDGCISRMFPGGGWQRQNSDCDTSHAAAGDDDVIYRIDLNGDMYSRKNGKDWTLEQMPAATGTMTYVDVQSKNRVIVTDVNYVAWMWEGSAWRKLEGPPCVQATINHKSVFCIDEPGSIYKIDLRDN